MQNFWIVPAPSRNLEQENKHIDQNQYEHRRRASKLTAPSGRSDVVIGGNGTERTWMWSVRFQMAKQPDLLAQFGGRMENLESCTKSSSRFIISLRSELRYFSQCDRRQRQQKEPCRAGDIPADI